MKRPIRSSAGSTFGAESAARKETKSGSGGRITKVPINRTACCGVRSGRSRFVAIQRTMLVKLSESPPLGQRRQIASHRVADLKKRTHRIAPRHAASVHAVVGQRLLHQAKPAASSKRARPEFIIRRSYMPGSSSPMRRAPNVDHRR